VEFAILHLVQSLAHGGVQCTLVEWKEGATQVWVKWQVGIFKFIEIVQKEEIVQIPQFL
jgi:hypothetical protein